VRAEVDETVILPEAADDSAEATGTTPVIVDVLANDTLDGLAIPATGIVSVVTQPANGVAVVNADGTITYTANADFGGSDAFTYTVTVADVVSNAATVAVVVTPEEVEVTPSGGGCGSCSTAAGREAPAGALLLVVGLMALRRRQRRART
jgi:MYXO-CTERM domain-containing protein